MRLALVMGLSTTGFVALAASSSAGDAWGPCVGPLVEKCEGTIVGALPDLLLCPVTGVIPDERPASVAGHFFCPP